MKPCFIWIILPFLIMQRVRKTQFYHMSQWFDRRVSIHKHKRHSALFKSIYNIWNGSNLVLHDLFPVSLWPLILVYTTHMTTHQIPRVMLFWISHCFTCTVIILFLCGHAIVSISLYKRWTEFFLLRLKKKRHYFRKIEIDVHVNILRVFVVAVTRSLCAVV